MTKCDTCYFFWEFIGVLPFFVSYIFPNFFLPCHIAHLIDLIDIKLPQASSPPRHYFSGK